MDAWLEVDQSVREESRGTGDLSPEACSQPSPNVDVVFSWTGEPNAVPPTFAPVLDGTLNYRPNPPAERVTSLRVTQHASKISTVRYEVAGKAGAVDVQAWSNQVIANDADLQPFRILKRRLQLVSACYFLASLAVLSAFSSRHWYYAESAGAGLLLLAAVVSPIAAIIPTVYAARPVASRKFPSWIAATLPVVAVVLLQTIVFASSAPSVGRANDRRASGDVKSARREALAAAELNIPGASALYDALQVESLRANTNPVSIWTQLKDARFFGDASRKRAEEYAVAMVGRAAIELQNNRQDQQSLVLLSGVPESFRALTPIREPTVTGNLHLVDAAWQTIRNSGNPLPARLGACTSVQAPLIALRNTDPAAASRFKGVEDSCELAHRAEAARVQKIEQAAKAAQLQAERRAREAERQAQRSINSWATAPLACRDGSLSPSCVCGGSHRGCCSHHGGVAGCSQ